MEYRLIRSSRRTLSAEISRDGELIVRAPRRCPQAVIDSFLSARADRIAECAEIQQRRREAHPEPDEEKRAELTALAKTIIPERVEYYAALMKLQPTGIKITSARTRFGSCSPKNSLCFSWRLMEFPAEAIDYVVVHELAHIVHRNHGRDFYALIETYLPDYKLRRALLRY